MSHFAVLVILPAEVVDLYQTPSLATRHAGSIQRKIEELLAPYNENLDVDEYDRPCWCIGSVARKTVNAIVQRQVERGKLPRIEDLRVTFHGLPQAERTDEKWQALIQPLVKAEEVAKKYQGGWDDPDPDCPDCHGTGTNKSTYNPDSKWDWWRIGGRWDGEILGEDVAKGRETDGGFNFSPFNELPEYNTRPIDKLLNGDEVVWAPYALVTPDGVWHERGEMGWFGMASNEKARDSWLDDVRALYRQYPDHYGVVVDCHI